LRSVSRQIQDCFSRRQTQAVRAAAQAKNEPAAKADDAKVEPQLKESAQENSVVLVSDVDLLTDAPLSRCRRSSASA